MGLIQDLFTAPAEQTWAWLACGWALAGRERHTITTSLWLRGATTVKHCSRFSVFLGGALDPARWQLWARVLRHAASWVPKQAPLVLEGEDSTKKKAGVHLDGVACYRNGAGAARQE